MKFKINNKIKYMQDFSFWEGIPAGIDFSIKKTLGHNKRFTLTAPGYGEINNYGNGSLYVYGLTKKQIERFRKEVKPIEDQL